MKSMGLIGGMSWESTAVYYSEINRQVRAKLGGLHSGHILMESLDFAGIVALQKAGDWDAAARVLGASAQHLAKGGADCVLICTNTMHIISEEVSALSPVPLIDIIDVTGAALKHAGMKRPLLLATRYSMEHGFYHDRMLALHGIEPIVPDAAERDAMHRIIFDELCCGVVSETSRVEVLAIIEQGIADGADSVILGCTEICMLIDQSHSKLPVFDSTSLHVAAAVDFALN